MCYKKRKHCKKRRNLLFLYIFLFFFFFSFAKGQMWWSCLRNKIVEFRQVSFFHAFYPAFISNSLAKGYVLSMNANDEGVEGYYGQLQLVMLYSCFKPLPHNFILNKTFISILYNTITCIYTPLRMMYMKI